MRSPESLRAVFLGNVFELVPLVGLSGREEAKLHENHFATKSLDEIAGEKNLVALECGHSLYMSQRELRNSIRERCLQSVENVFRYDGSIVG